MRHIKAKPSDEALKLKEVQKAMEEKKDEWLTPDFFTKLAANP